ncbi:MAG TPA: peptide chain release factor 1 [Deltaproteobacteria bacterium]|nr:MAG: peptide chain release factor 1 [Deltaproteobacteria bacterium GWC2_65_14]HBO69236.1 peptide chain release factor 1 [Deltaproteobacteria bacterium]
MQDKLASIAARVEEINRILSDPAVSGDRRELQKLGRELAELRPLSDAYGEHRRIVRELEENRELAQSEKDPEMRAMAKEEIARLSAEQERIEAQLRVLLLPKDPNDEKNILIEIRAGAGGEEAALFASELFRSYSMYAAGKGWKVEVLSQSDTGIGGTREVIAMIEGKGAYSRLKYESGVHRVQRVPETEAGGRIHTSTVTVAVIPEAEEVDVQIGPDDLRIDVFRSSGPGGQSVNTTDSAVRITHTPTGLVVSCQDEKSQLKNKSKALKILRSRLYDLELEKQRSERADMRRSLVGTGDRSERIRTYNFPQHRVTDHRIGLTVHQLSQVMDGGFDPFVEALVAHAQVEALKHTG